MFKPVFIEETTLDSMWFRLLSEIYDHGRINYIDSGSFAGSNRLEFDFVNGTIHYPTTRPLAPVMPEGFPVVATDEKIEEYFVNYLMNGKLEDNEHYKYATWLRGGQYKFPKINEVSVNNNTIIKNAKNIVIEVPDQVQWVIDHYKKGGFGNRHCYIQIGYPESNFAYDQQYKNESERGTSPCLRGIDSKIIKNNNLNELHFHIYFRSWDLFGAWPTNMGGFVYLQEYISNELGIGVGTLSFSSIKLHVYDFQIDGLKARLGK